MVRLANKWSWFPPEALTTKPVQPAQQPLAPGKALTSDSHECWDDSKEKNPWVSPIKRRLKQMANLELPCLKSTDGHLPPSRVPNITVITGAVTYLQGRPQIRLPSSCQHLTQLISQPLPQHPTHDNEPQLSRQLKLFVSFFSFLISALRTPVWSLVAHHTVVVFIYQLTWNAFCPIELFRWNKMLYCWFYNILANIINCCNAHPKNTTQWTTFSRNNQWVFRK